AHGQAVGVIAVVNAILGAGVVGQLGSGRTGVERDHTLVGGQLLHREPDRGIGQIDDDVDMIFVNPTPGGGGGPIGLVLMIGRHDLNGVAVDFAAKILDRHLHGSDPA